MLSLAEIVGEVGPATLKYTFCGRTTWSIWGDSAHSRGFAAAASLPLELPNVKSCVLEGSHSSIHGPRLPGDLAPAGWGV